MNPTILPYFGCVLGAAAMLMLLRPGPRQIQAVGAVLGVGALAFLLVQVAFRLANPQESGWSFGRHELFFALFSLIAVASAVRMITHHKPVYSALYFIMVVLSSAGLFLLMQAEFMAFALIIVYAGAILITYMFVLMLAQQAPDPDHPDAQPDYDRIAREPAAAAIVGFLMLALLTHMVTVGVAELPHASTAGQAKAAQWRSLDLMSGDLLAIVRLRHPDASLLADGNSGGVVRLDDDVPYVLASVPGGSAPLRVDLTENDLPGNIQMVGLDLVHKFPVSLELAGIILLMAMFGAVVLARKQIELGEDEVREAAGMRKLAFHADDADHPHSASFQPEGGER